MKIFYLSILLLTSAKIIGSENIHLTETSKTDFVNTGESVTAKNAKVSYINAGGSIIATNTIAKTLNAGGSITLDHCQITNMINTGGSFTADQCDLLGAITAGGAADISKCPSILSISAGGSVKIKDSNISGKLACSSNYLTLEGSKIDIIDINCSSKNKKEPQILELRNCKVRDIFFESGLGEVILLDQSSVSGSITGGKIQT